MPAAGLERDLNFERRGDLRRAFSVSKARAGGVTQAARFWATTCIKTKTQSVPQRALDARKTFSCR